MKQRLRIAGITLLVILGLFSGKVQADSVAVEIEAIPGDGTIVLGDLTFTIDPDAQFFARDERTPLSLSAFKEGDRVEYSVNSDGEIDEMWLTSE